MKRYTITWSQIFTGLGNFNNNDDRRKFIGSILTEDLGTPIRCTKIVAKNCDRWKVTIEGGGRAKEYFEYEVPRAIIRRRIKRG